MEEKEEFNQDLLNYITETTSNVRNLIDKLEKNDDIYVYYEGIKYHYVVDSKYNIEKTGKAKIINSSENKYITLITCNQKEKGYQVVVIGTIKDSTSY